MFDLDSVVIINSNFYKVLPIEDIACMTSPIHNMCQETSIQVHYTMEKIGRAGYLPSRQPWRKVQLLPANSRYYDGLFLVDVFNKEAWPYDANLINCLSNVPVFPTYPKPTIHSV